jgi:hypothetical protein
LFFSMFFPFAAYFAPSVLQSKDILCLQEELWHVSASGGALTCQRMSSRRCVCITFIHQDELWHQDSSFTHPLDFILYCFTA